MFVKVCGIKSLEELRVVEKYVNATGVVVECESPRSSSNPELKAEKLVKKIREYRVDFILLDTGKGSGETHDHRISRIIARKFDVVLAGGLNPENVAGIVEFVKPFGVDVSSGVETGGRKDEKKIRDFIEVLRFERASQDFCLK